MNKLCVLLVLLSLVIGNSTFVIAQKRGQARIDSLLSELSKAKEDTNKVNLLNNLSSHNITINSSEGLKYGKRGLELAKEFDWKKGIAKCYISLGANSFSLRNYSKSLVYWQKALKIDEELGNKNDVARHLSNIGIVYRNLFDYEKALKYYQKALKINEELGNKRSIAINNGNIGEIYKDKSDYEKALNYFHKALKMDEELGSINGVARHIGNIGGVYKDQFDYEKAMKYYQKALKMNEELDDKRGMAFNLGSMGDLYLSLTQDTILSKIEGKSNSFNLNKKLNLAKSLKLTLKAVEISENIGAKDKLIAWYNILQTAYKEKGDFKNAYIYKSKWVAVNDSVFNENNSKEIGILETKYEYEKKEQEAHIAAEKEAEEKSYSNTIQYSSISLFIILLFVSLFIIPNLNVPSGIIEGMVFITFLLFYELILVITEPYIDTWTSGIPIYKLGLNLAIALLFIPFHNYEKKLRLKYVGKRE
ncbi:tetratricopeptide repeat protein [Bacteroidota bacterium]